MLAGAARIAAAHYHLLAIGVFRIIIHLGINIAELELAAPGRHNTFLPFLGQMADTRALELAVFLVSEPPSGDADSPWIERRPGMPTAGNCL
jgi:hypothetical protein